MQIKEIKINDLSYPYLLSQIQNPPKIIYVIGNEEILREKSIAIVGCRQCSNYGANTARNTAYNLAKQNIITVSGLAKRDRYLLSCWYYWRKWKNHSSSCTWIRYDISKRKQRTS